MISMLPESVGASPTERQRGVDTAHAGHDQFDVPFAGRLDFWRIHFAQQVTATVHPDFPDRRRGDEQFVFNQQEVGHVTGLRYDRHVR
jgi:hypothetical protein